MPKVGDMRMIDGLIHEVAWVSRLSSGPQTWQALCTQYGRFVDGDEGVRAGAWTYPTCLECAGRT